MQYRFNPKTQSLDVTFSVSLDDIDAAMEPHGLTLYSMYDSDKPGLYQSVVNQVSMTVRDSLPEDIAQAVSDLYDGDLLDPERPNRSYDGKCAYCRHSVSHLATEHEHAVDAVDRRVREIIDLHVFDAGQRAAERVR